MFMRWRNGLMVAAAWALILLGVALSTIPVIPGVVFVALGLIVWSKASRWPTIRRRWLRRRYPALLGALDRAEARVLGWLRHA
jgi:uncharacterized protein YqgC (DUF456 family)